MHGRLRPAIIGLALLSFQPAIDPAFAQTYPQRPIHIVVPYPAGSGGDILPRLFGPALQADLGQPIVFENKPGASTTLGIGQVVKSKPDGYTLAFATSGITFAAYLTPIDYDFQRDLAPVALMATNPLVIAVSASVPARSVQELVAYAKANPGKLNFGSTGAASNTRISTEIFNRMAGIQGVHIPYAGGSPLATALAAGEIQYTVADVVSLKGALDTGRARALAVTTPKRSGLVPDLVTVGEAGYPSYRAGGWSCIFAPAGTPAEIVNRVSLAVRRSLEGPEIRQRLMASGADPAYGTPEELKQLLAEELERIGKVIKELNLGK